MSGLRSVITRLWAIGLSAAMVVAGLSFLPTSPAAYAASSDCNIRVGYPEPHHVNAIFGRTDNRTDYVLRRVYLEKGITNAWGDEPAERLGARADQHWCEYEYVFGVAMKVEYTFGANNENKVNYEAYYYEGSEIAGANCNIVGPTAESFRCYTHWSYGEGAHRNSIHVRFELVPH